MNRTAKIRTLAINDFGELSPSVDIMIKHEENTGRCYTRACNHNQDDGCVKPVDSPCPMLCMTTGKMGLGVGEDLRRKWT